MENAIASPAPTSSRTPFVVTGLLVLALSLGGLFYYKWLGSWHKVSGIQTAGAWTAPADGLTSGGVLKGSVYYFGKVWIALLFGIVIGAAVRALVSRRWIGRLLAEGGTARRQLAGGLAGAPLMLCSCCVTPVFTGLYERGARLGAALSVMLGSPGLNPAALLLTFILFPLDMSLARLAASLAAVFILPAVLERLFKEAKIAPAKLAGPEEEAPRTFAEFLVRFAKSLGYLTLITVPMIAAGVVLSALVLPAAASMTHAGAFVALVSIAAIAVVIALPTFFEIPLALAFLQAGLPGPAAAMLVAGPIVNLPSLFVLGRETNWKVASALAAGVWILAIGAGVAVIR